MNTVMTWTQEEVVSAPGELAAPPLIHGRFRQLSDAVAQSISSFPAENPVLVSLIYGSVPRSCRCTSDGSL
jgi:hypothetical protein